MNSGTSANVAARFARQSARGGAFYPGTFIEGLISLVDSKLAEKGFPVPRGTPGAQSQARCAPGESQEGREE